MRRGHTHGRLLGTSAGAITAALVAAGYTPAEMLAAVIQNENGKGAAMPADIKKALSLYKVCALAGNPAA